MGAPAIVMGDRITGMCTNHTTGYSPPVPVPFMPFSAPITTGTVASVLIGGKPAAVMGSLGINTPAHVVSDPPFTASPMQIGRIIAGSPTVLIGGQPAASASSTCTCCVVPGTLVPTVSNVLIG